MLKVPVERQPHVEQNVRRHARIAETGEGREREASRGGQRKERNGPVQCTEVAPDERAIDERFREIGHRQRERRADDAQRSDEREATPIRDDVAEGAAELSRHQSVSSAGQRLL